MTAHFRRPRQRAEDHLAWIRTLPCVICGSRHYVEAAHLRAPSPRHGKRQTGMGEKPDDSWALPLCPEHHRTGQQSQHSMGELAFWAMHNIDPFSLSLALWKASGQDEIGWLIIRETHR